jgi:hypothetical protein
VVQRAPVARHLHDVAQPRPRCQFDLPGRGRPAFEHHFKDWFWGRLGYRHGNAIDGGPFQENRLLAEQIFRMPLGFGFSADFRTREDFRWLNTGFFVRIRERIQVQCDVTIGNYLFTPYASAEVYFDTQYNQMSRYRLIVGVTLPIYQHFSVEPYLVRQVDNAGSFTITNAIGLTFITPCPRSAYAT